MSETSAIPPGPPVFPPPVNPDDLGKGPMIMGVTWTFTILAILAATYRMLVRRNAAGGGISIDDWLMFVAMIFQVAGQACISKAYTYGMGKHDVDLWMPDQAIAIGMWSWIATAPGMMVSITGRISIAITLVRLFGVRVWFKWSFIIFTTLMTISHIVLLICVWVQCTPTEGLWNPMSSAVCWDKDIVQSIMYLTQSFCTFADLAFVFLPVAIIWKLHMPLHRRLGLVFIMGVSLVTAGVSILKTVQILNQIILEPDSQYKASSKIISPTVEQALVIALGCVPSIYTATKGEFQALWNLGHSFVKLVSTTLTSTRRTTTATSSNYTGGNSGAYQDLEMSAKKGSHDGDSDKGLVADGRVTRTDVYSVEYSQATRK